MSWEAQFARELDFGDDPVRDTHLPGDLVDSDQSVWNALPHSVCIGRD